MRCKKYCNKQLLLHPASNLSTSYFTAKRVCYVIVKVKLYSVDVNTSL